MLKTDVGARSTVSYEHSFVPADGGGTAVVPLAAFAPFFRGRPAPGAPALDVAAVRRVAFMVRSFFGDRRQEGRFRLVIESLEVVAGGGEGGGTGGGEGEGGWEVVAAPAGADAARRQSWCAVM